MQGYGRWNRLAAKLLWGLVILGLLASLPMAYERVRTEASSKKVEFVFDYRDLLEISDYKPDPRAYVGQQLTELKRAKVTSLAVYEMTLRELELSRRLQTFTARDAALLTGQPAAPAENFTYVLFTDAAFAQTLQPAIEQSFASLNVTVRPWSAAGRQGLAIAMPKDEAELKPLGFDPFTLSDLQAAGFHLVARISNRHKPFVEADMDRLLAQLSQAGVKSMIIDGETAPGYTSTVGASHLKTMAELMDRYGISLATVELIQTPAGLGTIAKDLDYNVFRAHSFTEADADKLNGELDDPALKDKIQTTADRFVLAVKERNIRMVFLNARASKNPDRGVMADPVAAILASLEGPDGAVARIQDAGYQLGQAHAFHDFTTPLAQPLKWLVMLGSVAIIALLVSYFAPPALLPIFILGLIGTLGLSVLSPNVAYKLLALGAAVSAPTIGMMQAVGRIRRNAGAAVPSRLAMIISLFLRATCFSLIGAAFVVGLLNHMRYHLLLDQFTGVKLLGALPVALTALYVLLFSEGLDAAGIGRKAKRLLSSYISVIWVVLALIILGGGYYYLSRTGNEGQVTPLEMVFRSFLENTLGVRPRTKEFLIGDPLFFLGAYLALRYRIGALYVFAIGAVAQADIVGTFTHLHTPILVSVIRTVYGLLLGTIVGLLLIGVWEIVAKGWRRWARPARR